MFKNIKKLHIDLEIMNAIFIVVFFSVLILSNFLIGFNWLVFLIMAFFGFAISVFYPRSGLFALTFLTIIFERFFTLAGIFINKTEYKIYPLDIILIAIFASISIQLIFKIIKSVPMHTSDYLLWGFIFLNLVYFLAIVFTGGANLALAFSTFKNYAFYPLIYFATIILIENKEDLKRFFYFFLAGTIGIIGFLIFGIFNGGGLWTEFTPLSTAGVRILAFTHGLYLSLILPVGLVLLLFLKDKFQKNHFFFLWPVWFLGVLGTMMRHLWISLLFSIAIIFIFLSKEKRANLRKIALRLTTIFGFIFILVFYAILLNPNSKLADFSVNISKPFLERGMSIAGARTDESFAWRELVWNAAYKDFKNSPFLGIGTGKMVYVEKENYRDYIEVRNIHNSYLTVLIQLGILGFGILMIFFWKNIANLIKSIKKSGSELYKLSILGVLAVYFIAFFFQPYLETNLLSIFFWMALGLSRKISGNNFGQII